MATWASTGKFFRLLQSIHLVGDAEANLLLGEDGGWRMEDGGW